MSGYILGIQPNNVYSASDYANGIAPRTGTRGSTVDSNGYERGYVMCLVAASQNLTDGSLVTIDPSTFTATIVAAGPPAAKTASPLGVATCSVTASASTYIWIQVFGMTSVLSTASTLPNIALTMSATAGQVDDATSSTSAFISGLTLNVTTGATGLTSAFLNYPRFAYPSASL